MNAIANRRVARPTPPNRRVPTRIRGSAVFSDLAWEAIARSVKLSGRECQIVRAVFDDETDRALAQRLGISLHTVHTHVERLHRKLAIMNRPQLLVLVLREFLTLTVAPENQLPPICADHASHRCPFDA